MSAILKGRWTQQPTVPAGLNLSDPLSIYVRQLFSMVDGVRDVSPNNLSVTLGAQQPTAQITPRGIGRKTAGATNSYWSAVGHQLTKFSHELLYVPSTATSQAILGMAELPGSGTYDRTIGILSTGKFSFRIYDGAGKQAISTTSASVGTPVHIVATADGATIKIYVNGKLEATTAAGNAYTGYTSPELVAGYGDIGDGSSGGASTGNGTIVFAAVYSRALLADEVFTRSNHVWQLFAPSVKRIYFTAPGGGVTASLTGVSSTTAVGSLSTSAGVSQSLTGVSSSVGIGSLGVGAGASSTLSGVASVTAVGSLSNSAGVGITLSGVAATTAVGTLVADASGAVSVALTGLASTTAVGVLSTSAGVNVPLSGRSATSGVGSLSTSIGYGVVLSGVSATASVGSLSTVSNVNQTINGVFATCSVGSLVASVAGVVPNASRRRITLINRVDRSSLVRRVSRKTII